MLNIVVSILAGVVVYCLCWIHTLRRISDIDDETFKLLRDIIATQDKQITNLQKKIADIDKYIHEVL